MGKICIEREILRAVMFVRTNFLHACAGHGFAQPFNNCLFLGTCPQSMHIVAPETKIAQDSSAGIDKEGLNAADSQDCLDIFA